MLFFMAASSHYTILEGELARSHSRLIVVESFDQVVAGAAATAVYSRAAVGAAIVDIQATLPGTAPATIVMKLFWSRVFPAASAAIFGCQSGSTGKIRGLHRLCTRLGQSLARW